MRAHKIVLAARSPVFEAMFFGPCADGCSEIKLEVDHLEGFRLFLRYLYCDTVELDEHSAPIVMELAHKYQVETLVLFCADFLKTCVRVENACQILQLALFYEVNELRDHVCNVIDKNAEVVFETEGFMNIFVDCLAYILKGNTLYAKEVTILEKAIEWARGRCHGIPTESIDGQKIRKVLKHAFDFIRAPIMTLSEFVSCYGRKGYLSIEEYDDILEHISGNTSLEDVCNRSLRRSPLSEIVPVCIISNLLKDSRHSQTITSTLQIEVKEDVTISTLKLAEFNAFIPFGKALFSIGETLTKAQAKRSDLAFFKGTSIYLNPYYQCVSTGEMLSVHNLISRELDISMKITCTQLDYDAEFTLRNTGNTVLLPNPLRLQKANSPYQVRISAQFKSQQTSICSKYSTYMYLSTQKSKSGLMSVKADGVGQILVTEITFCRNSGRND